jgi:hypothetical protein
MDTLPLVSHLVKLPASLQVACAPATGAAINAAAATLGTNRILT